jgi:hypothetical protein
MDWVRHHDRYDDAVSCEPTGHYTLSNDSGTCYGASN